MAICSHLAAIMVSHRTPFLLLAAVLIPTLVWAADYTGRVVRVIDGDTIEVLNGNHAERIRLSDVDCPEKGQSYGQRAKQAESELVFRKEVTVQTHGHEKYGHSPC